MNSASASESDSDPPIGSDRIGVLTFKWYQSLGLGGSTNDFEIVYDMHCIHI